jgi:hypothetical protein
MELKKSAIAAVISSATVFAPISNAETIIDSDKTMYQATPFEKKTLGLISKLLIPTNKESSTKYQELLVKAFLEDNKDSKDILKDIKEDIGVRIEVPDSFRNEFNKNTFHFNTNTKIIEATEKRKQIIVNSLEYDNLKNAAVYGQEMANQRTEGLLKNASVITLVEMSFGKTEIKVGNEELIIEKQNKKTQQLKDTIDAINNDPMLSIELEKARSYSENYDGYNASGVLDAISEMLKNKTNSTVNSTEVKKKGRNTYI